MNSNLLGMLGLAKRGGMLAVGEEPAQDAAQQKNARLLLLASDAAVNTERRIQRFADEGSCLWAKAPFTKTELGNEVGRASCAILAVTDIGMAAAIARRLAETDASRYGELAEKLDVKAKRAAERKAERHNREKAEERARRTAPKSGKKEPVKKAESSGKRAGFGAPARSEKPGSYRSENRNRAGSYGKKPGGFGNRDGKFDGERRGGYAGKPGGERRSSGNSYGKGDGERRTFGGSRSGGSSFSHSSGHSFHAPSRPFAGSKPVKKGKGSFRKKPDGK